MRFEANTRELLMQAAARARSMGHSYVGSAHLLLALAQGGGISAALLRGGGFDPELAFQMALIL